MKSLNGLDPENEQALRNPGNGEWMGEWTGYPRVDAKEAEALRNGKAYRPRDFDMERLGDAAMGLGFNGNPDTDPLVIKCLAKGFIVENPALIAEKEREAQRIAELKAQFGEGNYSVGVGGYSHNRWILTDAGREFVRQIGIE